NSATLRLQSGDVTVSQTGLVKIRIRRLTDLASGEIAAGKTLDVHLGSFTTGTFEDSPAVGTTLGAITTDGRGNFSGTIDTGDGTPFAFAHGSTVSAQFVLNDPGIRSEFITG